MSTFLPPEVLAGLDAARKLSRKESARLNVQTGGRTFKILRTWNNGFALDADEAPQLRGLVDMFDGTRHVSRCLIVASGETDGELEFEYKLSTEVVDRPPLDFYRAPSAPVALLERFAKNLNHRFSRNARII